MENNHDVKKINDLIKYRRSIYPNQFIEGKAIPDDIIWQMLENANHAPNHKQTEPWRFTVFSSDGLKYFAELQAEIYLKYAGASFKQARFQKLLDYPVKSSHVIAIGMKRSGKKDLLPEIEEIEAVACSVQNILLTVTAYKLGCYWTTAGITYMKEAKSYFGLEIEDRLLGFLYMGYVKDIIADESKRKPITEKVNWIKTYSKFSI